MILKPRSRQLLSIVSKMSREKIINKHQRGLLKDMIISKDKRILECLK